MFTDHRVVSLSSFKTLWLRLCGNTVRCKPSTDLCWTCQKYYSTAMRKVNLPETQKKESAKPHLQHLSHVEGEWGLYRAQVVQAVKAVSAGTKLTNVVKPANLESMHYSFDFVQQVHYLANPMQPGPIYFLTPRKCVLFGVCCEAISQQVNYLVDEGVCCRKGSNAVISYLHHFLETYGLGERNVDFHCDNCSGQNKNKLLCGIQCCSYAGRRRAGPPSTVNLRL